MISVMNIKRTLCAALAFFFCFVASASPPRRADAYSAYGRVIERDVGFYKDPQAEQLLFYLPYTYYVKIDEKSQSVSRAELFCGEYSTPAIDGYVFTDDFYYEESVPVSPFYEKVLTTASSAGFYADAGCTRLTRHIFENRSLKYYGYAYDAVGNYVYFVDYNDELGYVREECIVPFEFTPHPAPLPVEESPVTTPPEDDPQPEGDNTGLKIAIVASLALAVAVILLFSVRPSAKKDRSEDIDQDNDFR